MKPKHFHNIFILCLLKSVPETVWHSRNQLKCFKRIKYGIFFMLLDFGVFVFQIFFFVENE